MTKPESGLLPALAFALVGVVSLVLAAPSVHWLDSGNLVASAWTMGVAHPPGEPLYLALARLAQLLPIGDIAFRVTLLSCFSMALCAPILHWLSGGGWLGFSLSAAALLGFAAQAQAGRPELYAPLALLLLLGLVSARRGGLVGWAGIGSLLALGVSIHPLLCAAAAPGLVWLVARENTTRGLALGVAAGLPALLALLWLPLRAIANPAGAWGIPDSPSRFVDVLLARNFARNFGPESGGMLENARLIWSIWLAEGMLLLVLVGLVASILRRRPVGRRLLGFSLLWLAGNAMTILPQNKVFETNPDLYGYLLIGTLGLVPLAGQLLRPLGRFGLGLAALVALLQLNSGLSVGLPSNFLAHSFSASQSAGLPTGSILMTSGNDTAFTWSYLQRVERRRPDLILVHRVLVGHPAEEVRLGGQAGRAALGLPWEPRFQQEPISYAAGLRRPFFIELREGESAAVESGNYLPHGMVVSAPRQTVSGLVPPAPETPWLASLRQSRLAEMSEPSFGGDDQTRLVRDYFGALFVGGLQ